MGKDLGGVGSGLMLTFTMLGFPSLFLRQSMHLIHAFPAAFHYLSPGSVHFSHPLFFLFF